MSCISFDSYIKPQPERIDVQPVSVVYPLIPTSNHNLRGSSEGVAELYILWFLHQTTTNVLGHCSLAGCISFDSYIKPQLNTCIEILKIVVYPLIPTSNHNYIAGVTGLPKVVYPLIPTSNHNEQLSDLKNPTLYILWFLHQTTTLSSMPWAIKCCISFDSYIKPQLIPFRYHNVWCCISFDSYIKPQPFYLFILRR